MIERWTQAISHEKVMQKQKNSSKSERYNISMIENFYLDIFTIEEKRFWQLQNLNFHIGH